MSYEKMEGGEVVVDVDHMNCFSKFDRDGRVTFRPCLNVVRFHTVHSYIVHLVFCGVNVTKVVDFGCGDKRFLMQYLLKTPCLTDVVCVDKNLGYLVREKLLWQADYDRRPLSLRVRLIEANLLDLPQPTAAPHVLTLIEVIEHFRVDELPRLLWGIFGVLKPKVVVITTPNTDFNDSSPLPEGKQFRHPDHKFEWSSKEFQHLCVELTNIYVEYVVTFDGCGLDKYSKSYCSQIAVFARDDILFNSEQVALCAQPVVKALLAEVADARAAKEKLKSRCEPFGKSVKNLWYEKKRPKGTIFLPLTKNEEAIDWVLKVIQYAETMPGISSIKTPVSADYWSQWTSMAVELLVPRCIEEEADEPPCMKRFLSKKFVLIQDITYQNVFALLFNEMKYRIQSFTWCLNPHNEHYPFADKVLKLNEKWDHMDTVQINLTVCKCYLTFLKLMPPSESQGDKKSNFDVTRYDDEQDGACQPSHRTHIRYCRKCPFLYFKRAQMAPNDVVPKKLTIQSWQNHVVYENYSQTKIYFSFVMLQRYLGFLQDDSFIRVALKDMQYERLFVAQREYWSCSIGEGSSDSSVKNSPAATGDKLKLVDECAIYRGVIGELSDQKFAERIHSVWEVLPKPTTAGEVVRSPCVLVEALHKMFPYATVTLASPSTA